MRIFLFRHFEKAFSRSSDPELNPKGLEQAAALREQVLAKNPFPEPQLLFTSPKRRAQDSFLPLAGALGQELIVDQRLDERLFAQNESRMDFQGRIREFLEQLEDHASSTKDCFYLCTHADWIEEFLSIAAIDVPDASQLMHWPSGRYELFEVQGSLWQHQFGGEI